MSTLIATAVRVSRTDAHAHFTAGGAVAVLDSRDGWPDSLEIGPSATLHTRDSIPWDELIALCAGDPGPARTLFYRVSW